MTSNVNSVLVPNLKVSSGERTPSMDLAQTVLLCDNADSAAAGGKTAPLHYPSGSQPRRSLHGKPISLRHHRRDARYRKAQAKIYNFLERPRGFRAITYHMLVFLLVFGCFCLTVISTVPDFEDSTQQPLFWMELIVVVWFTAEFLLRMWSVGCRSRYQGAQGRLQFFKRPFTIIDTIVIVASIVVLGIGSHGQVFAASALRGLRFFQILRMVRMDRRGGTWKLLGSVVWAHRQELLTTFYIGFLGLIFSSFLIYLVEKDMNDRFGTFADALWWGVITLATVGYGDSVPISWKGKLIAGVCAMMGISFFALPASILGSGFALKVQQQQRQKHLIRRRNPAALLIQCMWRCYAADERSCSVATWEPHLRGLRLQQSAATMIPHVPSKFHPPSTSFVSRFSTIKRPKHHPSPNRPPTLASNHAPHLQIGKTLSANSMVASVATPQVKSSSTSELLLHRDNSARKTFSAPSEHDVPNHRSAEGNTSQRVLQQRRMALTQTDDIRRALEDDEDVGSVDIQQPELTARQRTAIRAIRKMKYLVAKRKFREALKPYDVKDVIEQYSAGHVDLLARVKNLQQRCDQILGKQNSKSLDTYDSKVCLAARVVKIERQVDDIEGKIDTVLDILIQQRNQRNMESSPGNRPPELTRGNNTPPVTKLRSILMSSGPTFLSIPPAEDAHREDVVANADPLEQPVSRLHSNFQLRNASEQASASKTPQQSQDSPPSHSHPTDRSDPKTAMNELHSSHAHFHSAKTKPRTALKFDVLDEPAFIDQDSSSDHTTQMV